MSMSSGSDFDSDDGMLNDINMTPLIDVMLVLLIIFIVTLPVINGAVKVELPQTSSQAMEAQAHQVDISIDASGVISWDKAAVSEEALQAKVAEAMSRGAEAAPTVRIYADRNVRYERVALVLSTVQGGGLNKIDFVTETATTK